MCLVINVNLSGINQGDCAGRNAEKRCRHEGTQQLVKWLHHRRRRRSSFRRHVKLFPIIFIRNKKEPKERKRSVYIKRRFKLCHNSLYFAFHHIKYGAKSRIFFDMISQIKREREHKTEKLLDEIFCLGFHFCFFPVSRTDKLAFSGGGKKAR